jgi:hypothetical protein
MPNRQASNTWLAGHEDLIGLQHHRNDCVKQDLSRFSERFFDPHVKEYALAKRRELNG